jgi:hypothetical protein
MANTTVTAAIHRSTYYREEKMVKIWEKEDQSKTITSWLDSLVFPASISF